MKFVEDVYCDFLYDCHIANKKLTEEDWEFYGKEVHHTEIPKCENGLLVPLNSQPLTTYQHWIAGVLQSEIWGRKCFAMVPAGVLPPMFEMLRKKWQAIHNQTAQFTLRSREFYAEMGKKGGKQNKGKPGRKRTPEEIEKFRQMASQPKSEETKQKLRENYYDVTGWFWVTNGTEETMVPPDYEFTDGWKRGRLSQSEKTRKLKSIANSGENNPMYGVEPKTKSMRWYKNLKEITEKMFTPGEEPDGWVRGRLTARDRR